MQLLTILPRTLQDKCAFFFIVTCLVCLYFFEVFIVLPKLDCYLSLFWFIQSVSGLYILCNILGNLYLMMANDTSTLKLILPAKLTPGWKFCSQCEANSPPRSYHCATCQRCILKRDHHCTFSGCCVGHRNTRYFIALLLHLCVGSLYSAVLNSRFIWSVVDILSIKSAIMHIFPFIFWLLGYIDTKTTIWSFLSVVNTLGGIFACVLLYVHTFQIFKNLTSYERTVIKPLENKFDLGWRQNLVEILGRNWKLIWLWPTIESKLPGDGVKFPTLAEFNLNSNKKK